MRLIIDIKGDKQVDRKLMRISMKAGDVRPAFRVILDDIRKITKKQFGTEGKHRSGGWEPLKDSTIARKQAAQLDTRIMRATYKLMDSLITRMHPEGVQEIKPQEMVFGTKVDYAVHHQHGAPRANLPQRRLVEFNEPDKRRFMKTLQRYIVTGELGV